MAYTVTPAPIAMVRPAGTTSVHLSNQLVPAASDRSATSSPQGSRSAVALIVLFGSRPVSPRMDSEASQPSASMPLKAWRNASDGRQQSACDNHGHRNTVGRCGSRKCGFF